MIGAALRTYLLTKTTITAIVAQRIHAGKLPQGGALPAIRYATISGQSSDHLTGAAGRAKPTIQIDCYAETPLAANDLAEVVRVSLQGHRGDLGGVFSHGVSLRGFREGYEPPIDGSDVGKYRVSIDFDISHVEATTTTP